MNQVKLIKPIYIYALYDPTFKSQKFYIGKTVNPKKRLYDHLSKTKLKSKTYKNNWIKSLLSKGIKPALFIICTVPNYISWQEAESQWISFLKLCNITLTNSTSGGDGFPDLPQENIDIKYKKIKQSKIKNNKIKIGNIYTYLKVVELIGTKDGRFLWKCECKCGNIVQVMSKYLLNKHKQSCGCLNSELASKRGSTEKTKIHLSNIRKNNKPRSNCGLKGVYFNTNQNKYFVSIGFNKKRIFIGTFDNSVEAAKAYDQMAFKLYGSEIYLNFPELFIV